MRPTIISLIFLLAVLMQLTACGRTADSPAGFSLPKGDPSRGQELFTSFQCGSCHFLPGEGSTTVETEAAENKITHKIRIGREVPHVVTYAELVTSVINPSHRISTRYGREMMTPEGNSKMQNYNDVMTISELIDLVAFLQPLYKVVPYQPTNYGIYP